MRKTCMYYLYYGLERPSLRRRMGVHYENVKQALNIVASSASG